MYIVQCVLCSLYPVQCVLCTLYPVQCVLCTLYPVQCILCTLYPVQCVLCRGGFRIFSRGWQRYLQGVAKISQGVAKKLLAIPFLSAFSAFLHNITNLGPLFFTFSTHVTYKEIHKIYL